MGNSVSISIVLEEGKQGAYTAGELMKGRVVVRTRHAIKWGELKLVLIGKEKVAIQQLSWSQEEHVIFSANTVLRYFLDQPASQQGIYEQPFDIILPHCLPSSTSNPPGTHGGLGFRIQYKLRAELYSHKQEINVKIRSAPLPKSKIPYQIEPVFLPKQGGLLPKRGTVTLGVRVDDVNVAKGEELIIHLVGHNDSSTSIPRVKVRVIEYMKWRTSKHVQHESKTLVSVANVNVPGLVEDTCSKARGQGPRRNNDDQQPRETDRVVFQEIRDALAAAGDKKIVALRIPMMTAHDSYKGHLIQVSHMLEVQLQTTGTMMMPVARNPSSITMKICVGTRSTASKSNMRRTRILLPNNNNNNTSVEVM